jgi:hypothetical protein
MSGVGNDARKQWGRVKNLKTKLNSQKQNPLEGIVTNMTL